MTVILANRDIPRDVEKARDNHGTVWQRDGSNGDFVTVDGFHRQSASALSASTDLVVLQSGNTGE